MKAPGRKCSVKITTSTFHLSDENHTIPTVIGCNEWSTHLEMRAGDRCGSVTSKWFEKGPPTTLYDGWE